MLTWRRSPSLSGSWLAFSLSAVETRNFASDSARLPSLVQALVLLITLRKTTESRSERRFPPEPSPRLALPPAMLYRIAIRPLLSLPLPLSGSRQPPYLNT